MLAATWAGLLLVVGGSAVPGWVVAGACLSGALLVLLHRSRRPRGRVPRWAVATVLVAGTLGGGVAALADLGYGAAYLSLDPASAGGCRVVVRETSFLRAGGGSIFVVDGSTGIARRALTYTADEGYRPVAAGAVTLTWRDGVGTLHGLDPSYDPGGAAGDGYAVRCD